MARRNRPRWIRTGAALGTLVLLAAACSDDGESSSAAETTAAGAVASTTTEVAPLEDPYDGYVSDLYDGENWLCRPDQEDVCDVGLDATAVHADGSVDVIEHRPGAEPAVDCFYVYPTVSADPTVNADLDPGPEEDNAALNQVARFSSLCRVFAPVYRQITVAGLTSFGDEGARERAYGDVLDAWKQYVSNDNEGRGVVLVGHSQGSGHLNRLIGEEIDGVPALQDRLVSAVLLGSSVAVPDGEVVGGDFADVPVCTEEGEVGCIVSYATFRATAPPPSDTYFGEVEGPDRAACTNPAALGGGSGELTPYFPAGPAEPFAPGADREPITTPWVTYPDFLTAACVREGEVDWLELTVAGDPDDPRTDDIPGDLTPEWGLHLVDANIAMGDLVDLVGTQVAAYEG